MSEQEAPSRTPTTPTRWRVRVCRWLWRGLGFVWGTLIVGIIIATIANLNTTTTDTPLAKLYIVHLAQTYPLPVWSSLGLLAVLTLLSWLGSRDKQTTPARPLSEQDRVHLLGRLRLRYEQLLTQSLEGAVQQLELELAERPAAVQNPVSLVMRLSDQPEQLLPPHTSIVDVYRQANKELLILGEPGAGKSTLLLKLAHYLVQQAEQNPKLPLPVLLPLSTWAVSRRSLDEWLSKEAARLYDVPRRLSQQWIQAEQLLPLLDGLDEMEEAARGACIAAINTYHHEHLRPLVVCSRSNEYIAAARHERLALHTAVVVQPLEPGQVNAYLASLDEPPAGLRAALQSNPLLQQLATTPLMLQVLMLTYHGTLVQVLPQQEDLLREQIWTDYMQRMVERKGDARRYPLHVTRAWLSWLAREMREHNQTIFSLEQLQPDWLPKGRKTIYQWSGGLLFGLVGGLVGGLYGGLLFGLVGGLVGGLYGGLYSGLLFWLYSGPVLGLVLGPVLGLVGRYAWKQRTERLALSPNEGIRRSVKNGLVGGLYSGLVLGLVLGLVDGLLFGLVRGLLFGLVGGLYSGLLFGLVLGLGAAVQHYTLRFWLTRSGVFPWRAVPFLEDATARILLRRVGGGYSFAHRLLLDFFANAYAGASAAPPAAQSILPSPP